MGDRAMAEIRTEEGSLFVYAHWGGSSLPENAKAAIRAARPRWSDSPYAVRIIVDQLTKDRRDQETGFGLLLTPIAEDEHNGGKPSVVIDLIAQELTILRNGNRESFTFQEVAG